jgi:hypothetical protein
MGGRDAKMPTCSRHDGFETCWLDAFRVSNRPLTFDRTVGGINRQAMLIFIYAKEMVQREQVGDEKNWNYSVCDFAFS